MQITTTLLTTFLLSLTALASENGRCTGSKATGDWAMSGICIDEDRCRGTYKGRTKTGACPHDPNNIKCCLIGVGTPTPNPCGGASKCDWTVNGCPGTWVSNHCPGESNYKCCKLS